MNVENTRTELQAAVKQVFLDLKNEIDAVETRVDGGGRRTRINGRLLHSKYIFRLEPSHLKRDLPVKINVIWRNFSVNMCLNLRVFFVNTIDNLT